MAKPEDKGLVGRLETAVKLVGIVAGLSTLLGFFALWGQLTRLRAPLSLFSLADAAKAGLVPTIMFGVAAIICYHAAGNAYRCLSRSETGNTARLGSSFLLLSLVLLCLLSLGTLLGVAALIGKLAGELGGLPPAAEFAAGVGGLLALLGLPLLLAFLLGRLKRLLGRATRKTDVAELPGPPPDDPPLRAPDTIAQGLLDIHRYAAGEYDLTGYIWIITLFFLAGVGGLVWLSRVLSLSYGLLPDLDFPWWLLAAFLFGCLMSILRFAGCRLVSAADNVAAAFKANFLTALFASFLFLCGFTFYTLGGYALLSPVFGGGRQEQLALWIDEDADAALDAQLAGLGCRRGEHFIHCPSVPVVTLGDNLLIPVAEGGPAIVLKRSAVQAMRLAP
jgi:hypothetical protein